jgi:hypothetical protein
MAGWRSITPVLAACAPLCAGALLAACGSSSSPPPAYVARANQICATQEAVLARLPRPTTPEQAVTYLPHLLAVLHAERTQLSALDPGAAGRSELDASLGDVSRLSALLSGFLHHLKTGLVELTTFSQVQAQSDALRTQLDAHFRRAGLARCVQ